MKGRPEKSGEVSGQFSERSLWRFQLAGFSLLRHECLSKSEFGWQAARGFDGDVGAPILWPLAFRHLLDLFHGFPGRSELNPVFPVTLSALTGRFIAFPAANWAFGIGAN